MNYSKKTVHLYNYKQVIDLKKKGKLAVYIAYLLEISKDEVQKIIIHFDNLIKNQKV